jgi:hypothetical protein
MAHLQIVRGPAPLPANIEDEFRLAYGREMNEQEREFYGLESGPIREQVQQLLKAA